MATVAVVSHGVGRKPPSEIHLEGEIAYVALTRGFRAVIDAQDIPIVSGYRWTTLINSSTGHAYAVRHEKGRCILMHRALLAAPQGMQVDHDDGDGMNNRRKNIRLATPSQNQANRVMDRRNKLNAKGVWEDRQRKRPFRAYIQKDGRTIHLGDYASKGEASAAYMGAAKALYGKFARAE